MGLVIRNAHSLQPPTQKQQPDSLNVIIVGSGLGGLAAALALRQQGHTVRIYEASGFSKEVGAALHTSPNGNGALKGLGISCKDIGAPVAEWLSEWTPDGVRVKKTDLLAFTKIYEHSWRLAHRIKLHEALKKAATEEAGPGQPAKLHLSKPVVDIDSANAIVYFKDGTSAQGDVVIGADGIHSIARTKLPGGHIQPFPSGHSAFRFLMSRDVVLADPRTSKFAEGDGEFHGIFSKTRSVIIYPTSHNEILNFICIHPDSESASTEGWGSKASRSKLLEVYKEFHPDVLALLEKADEESMRVWKLLDMEPLPTWHYERLCVIGDAAHPFLPYLGQGAAIAIEDAVAIGVLLERGLGKEEIPDRLELYQKIRKERGELIQEYTRQSGKARGEKSSFNAAEFQPYCFGHNEKDNSARILKEWKWAKLAKTGYPITSVFGPNPVVQRQLESGSRFTVQPSFCVISIRFETSRTVLDGLLPPGNRSFRFKSPGSKAQCTFRITSLTGLPSHEKLEFNSLGLYIHGVEYKDKDGQVVSGAFLPVVLENMVHPMTTDYEALGVTKALSTIDIERDNSSCQVHLAWQGTKWGNFLLEGIGAVKQASNCNGDSSLTTSDEGVIIHQYVPELKGDTASLHDSECTTYIPPKANVQSPVASLTDSSNDDSQPGSKVERILNAESATFQFNAGTWDELPTLYHIISRLQEIPNRNILRAEIIEGVGMPPFI